MTRIKSRPAALLALVVTAATFVLVSPASPAAAQTCGPGQVPNPADPYGCISTTTTTTGSTQPLVPQCIMSDDRGVVGATVEVIITNVPVGISVGLFVGSVEVDREVSGAGGGSAAGALTAGPAKSARSAAAPKAPAQGPYADVTFRFTVPALSAGTHAVFAVGPNFRCDCFPFTILRDVEGTNTNRGGGSLARTGFTVLGLLVIAAVLLVVGRAMVESSRRRPSRPTGSA